MILEMIEFELLERNRFHFLQLHCRIPVRTSYQGVKGVTDSLEW